MTPPMTDAERQRKSRQAKKERQEKELFAPEKYLALALARLLASGQLPNEIAEPIISEAYKIGLEHIGGGNVIHEKYLLHNLRQFFAATGDK